MQLLVLNSEAVRTALPMKAAIDAVKTAYAQLSSGNAQIPLRTKLSNPKQDGTVLIMPAYLEETEDLAVKIVSVFPRNPSNNEPTIYAAVLALDPNSGRPLALLEGGTLTAIRTGAASGAATELLARGDSHVVGIFGSGVQARTQLEAVCTVRPIDQVNIFSIDREGAEIFAAQLAGQGPIPPGIHIVDTPSEAVRSADIICTATTSERPVFDAEDLQAGVHINAIGSFTPEMQEIGSETVRKARVFVDSHEAAMDEAGDLLIPLREGLIDELHIVGEIGQVVLGELEGRTSDDEITLFKSVGVAVQDAVTASLALEGARRQGLGASIDI